MGQRPCSRSFRFNRSLTRADIAELTEQYLEIRAFKHDCMIANIGHYPEPEAFPSCSDATSIDDPDESADSDEAAAKASLNDPAQIAFLYKNYLDGLKRDRALNNFTSVRGEAQQLALNNEIDLDTHSQECALCRALLDVDITIAEEKLAYLNDVVLPHHPLHATNPRTVIQAPVAEVNAPPAPMLRRAQELFSESWPTYGKDRVVSGDWKPSIERQSRSTARLFIEICGDKPLAAYGPADAAEFKRTLLSLPANYDKCTEWRDIRRQHGMCGLVDHCKGNASIDRVKPQTFNRHLAALSGIWPWAQINEVVAKDSPSIFEGLHVNLKRTRSRYHKARDERPMWDLAELAAVLNAPLFTGLRNRRSWKKAGPSVLRDERYCGVLVGCHSGMRRGEIFLLRVRHVVKDFSTGIWYFDLKDPSLDLKAEGRIRWVPLHRNLLTLGFIEA